MVHRPFHFAMLTHPGRVRKRNEDICAGSSETGAFVVCDGMGGAAAGEVASRMAAESFLESLASQADGHEPPGSALTPSTQRRLQQAIQAANHAVFQHARQSPGRRGMGTTLVALLYEAAGAGQPAALTLAHVGDSRCYRWRNHELTLLTADHSLVEEQVRSGKLTPLEALQHPWRNIITRAIGTQATVEAEMQPLAPLPGDLYLLASDGLTRELSQEEIAEEFRRAYGAAVSPCLGELAQALIDRANEAGGGDNITVLLFALRQRTPQDDSE
jgi:protein phosphatase